tara:strand:- start:2185 stop:2817 length:633 start_codon:yes stop_codon:yes gene_type:complete
MNLDSREMINSLRDILICHRNIVETNTSIVRLYNNIVSENVAQSIRTRVRPVRSQRRTQVPPQQEDDEQTENGMTQEQISETTTAGLFSDFSETNTERRCPISWSTFDDNTPVIRINGCGHIFSPEPLREWLTRHSTCPTCRFNLTPNEDTSRPTPIGIDIMTATAGNTAARLFADIIQGSPIDTAENLAALAQTIEQNVPNMLNINTHT